MNELIEKIKAKIAEYDELEKQASERGNINSSLMYINQKAGMYEVLDIIGGLEK